MMKKIILITLLLILAGCNDSKDDEHKPVPVEVSDWNMAPRVYKCTDVEIIKVHMEAEWCNEHTSYFRNYCYGTAMIRNCTKMDSTK